MMASQRIGRRIEKKVLLEAQRLARHAVNSFHGLFPRFLQPHNAPAGLPLL